MHHAILCSTDSTSGAGGGDKSHAEIGTQPSAGTRAQIEASHRRVEASGADPDHHAPRRLDADEIARRRDESPLKVGMDRLQRIFAETTDSTAMLIGIFDADGVLLWRGGETRMMPIADKLQLTDGTVWDEESVNTTAVGLVMADSRPIRLVGDDHYNRVLHSLYCAAAPMHDPRTGALLGIVGLAGAVDDVQPSSTAFATTLAALAEHEIAGAHTRSLAELRKSASARVAGIRGPSILVDPDGWVADTRGCTPPESVAAPTDGGHQFVPGIGTCVASRVGDGFLLRRVGPANPIVAELDLRGEPSLSVVGDGEDWRTVLTRRHAQILLLLAEAKETGLTSARLSRLIFGDTGHVVTVRAEMSRLRRTVGALITSRPYRLAPGVRLHISSPPITPARGINGTNVVPNVTASHNGRESVHPHGVNGPRASTGQPDTPLAAKHRHLA